MEPVSPFETTCVVWLPSVTDALVAGTLRFDPTTGVRVELIGSLDPDEPLASVFSVPTVEELDQYAEAAESDAATYVDRDPGPVVPVLFGVTPNDEITLIGSVRAAHPGHSPGHPGESLSVDVMARGTHLPEGLGTPITSIAVSFDVLDDWYATLLLKQAPGVVEGTPTDGLTLRWKTPPPLEASLPSGDVISLLAGAFPNDGLRGFHIEVTSYFSVVYDAPMRLQDAIAVVSPLRWLASLVTRHPSSITRVRAVAADDGRRGFDVIYRAPVGPPKLRTIQPYEMAVPLPEFDVSAALPRWMEAASRFKVPLAMMFGNWFAPTTYAENRLLNAATAAEAFAALLYGNDRTDLAAQADAVEAFVASFPPHEHELLRARLEHINDPSLDDRLTRLVADAGAAFSLVVSSPEAWVKQVKRARNDIAHGVRLGRGARTRALSETIEFLIEVHLLLQLGLSVDAAAEALRGTPRTEWVADLYREHLSEAPKEPG